MEVEAWTKYMKDKTKDEILAYKIKDYFNKQQIVSLWARFNRKELPAVNSAELTECWKNTFSKANWNENKN